MTLMATLSREPLATLAEPAMRRRTCMALAILLAAAFFIYALYVCIPAHQGVDQNGYLVGAKMISQTGAMSFQPRRVDTGEIDPMQFVGHMWIGVDCGTPEERYSPKYPVGFPLVCALAMKIGGESHGVAAAYLVSPIAIALALVGVHLLARLFLGSIPALIVTLLIATNPVTLHQMTNPYGHSLALLLVVWGMYMLVRWWRWGGSLAALAAGLLLGSAVSVRYTEGMLLLPIGLAILFRLSDHGWRSRPQWLAATLLLFAWALPVGLLVVHNRLLLGAWSGYSHTNESTGVSFGYFVANWDMVLRLMYLSGLMLLFPMAVAGMAAGFAWNWRAALLLSSWILPCLLFYSAYYWAPEEFTVAYTRFFFCVFPPMVICAFGLLLWPSAQPDIAASGSRMRLAASLALAAVTLISMPFGLANVERTLHADLAIRRNLQSRADAILAHIPAESVIFTDDIQLLNHLQFVGNYVLYEAAAFRPRREAAPATAPVVAAPAGFDPQRSAYYARVTKGKTAAGMDRMRDQVIVGAISAGRRVFTFTSPATNQPLRPFTDPNTWPDRPESVSNIRLRLNPSLLGQDPLAIAQGAMARRGFGQLGRSTPITHQPATWQLHEITLN